MKDQIKILKKKSFKDKRGKFFKIIDGKERFNPHKCEVYITVANANESRGGHYHKLANEWFYLLKGECELIIINVETQKRKVIEMNALENDNVIHIPPGNAHIFINKSAHEDFILIAFTDIQYNKEDTIFYDFHK